MRISRSSSRSFLLLAASCLALAALSGCSPQTPAEAVERSNSDEWAASPLKAYPVGAPFELDGCRVQLHRVAVGVTRVPDVTLATAHCPTATVRATAGECGKNCSSDTIQVTPIPAPAPQPAPQSGPPVAEQQTAL
jgi:hypothetical protein